MWSNLTGVNVDYVGTVALSGNTFKYIKVDIQKSLDVIAELEEMKKNPNRTRMDMQSLFQMRYPKQQYFNYSLPCSYNDSFIEGISYPYIWDQDKYQQELKKRLPRDSKEYEYYLLTSKKITIMSEIAERVKAIIVDKLSVDENEVTPNASFSTDLGADSLDTVELIMEFEKEFGISIPDEEAEKIGTVGDAIAYIENNK